VHVSAELKSSLQLHRVMCGTLPGRCCALPRVNFVADLRPTIYSLLFKRYLSCYQRARR